MLAPRPTRVSSGPDALVTGWMNNNAVSLHPVFQPNGYDIQRAERKKPNKTQVEDLTLDFCRVIEQYQQTLPVKDVRRKIDIQGAHTWEEVMQAAKEAEAAYLAMAESKKGPKGVIRRYFRVAGDYSVAAKPWVGLLPNDSYMSVVSGSLKLVFEVAARRSERRMDILETFDTLPSIIMRTQRCHELFPDNLILRDRALAVYINLLSMIEAMIAGLIDKKFLDRVKDGLKGPLADRNIDDRRKLFKNSVDELNDQLQYLHLQSSEKANATIADMGPRVANTENILIRATVMTENIGTQMNDIHSSAGIIETGMRRLHMNMRAQEALTWNMNKRLEANSQATKELTSMLQGVLEYTEWRESNLTARLQYHDALINTQSRADLRAFQSGVRSLLQVDIDTDCPMLTTVMRQAQFFDQEEQGRAQWALRTDRFKSWLQARASDALLINGNGSDGLARWSSMSLLSALLAHSLSQQQSAYILNFFCGHHNSMGDPVSGPVGMMRVLITQLLSAHNFDLGFVRFGDWFDGLRVHDLSTLCRLFHKLLTQLPSVVVFCIIDGVSLFETSRWSEELAPVLRRLQFSVADDSLDCHFKVLFTSATISRGVKEILGPDNTLSTPSFAGDGSLLTDRSVMRSLTPSPTMHRREIKSMVGEGTLMPYQPQFLR